MIYLRSFIFTACFYVVTAAISISYLPVLLFPRKYVQSAGRIWAKSVFWLLKVVCGITYEVRGREHIQNGPVIYASKHQSAWDTMIFWILIQSPVFVLKQELTKIPFYGQVLLKLGSIPIDRKGGGDALKKMIIRAKQRLALNDSIIIFPEGTRKLPGAAPDYQPGAAALYSQLNVPVIPVALNSGVFWNKYSFVKKPGKIVIEFLPPIATGLRSRDFMKTLQEQVETASTRLAGN